MEIWKDNEGFEGSYQISNYGNVRSVDRIQADKNGRMVHYKSRIIRPVPNSRGYLRVGLKRRGTEKRLFLHRLVATHFVPNENPEKYTVVNHLDSDYLNNDAANLEWTDTVGNNRHAIEKGRMKRTKEWLQHLRETNERNGKAVIGANIQTGETVSYICLNDCAKDGFQPSCVSNCCKGVRGTHKGYAWRYATEREKAAMLTEWGA